MRRRSALFFLVLALSLAACAGSATSATSPRTYKRLKCPPPTGYKVVDCRVGIHGIPDLSRHAFKKLRNQEVSITNRIRSLAPNPDNGGTKRWPLLDSLGRTIGYIQQKDSGGLVLFDAAGKSYPVNTANSRGHGCALDSTQSSTYLLLQIIATKARASGLQAFVSSAAMDRSTSDGEAAYQAFVNQRGGGTGCGFAGPERGKVAPLKNPNVGAKSYARLGNGEINSVTEYDAKPEFGNVVYFSSNTTEVHNGGIARGMIAVGTPVAKVDEFAYCDPNGDRTVLWQYFSIHAGSKRFYGWIPARCPARLKSVKPR